MSFSKQLLDDQNYLPPELNNNIDDEYQYDEWLALQQASEQADFFRVFERTNTYPI